MVKHILKDGTELKDIAGHIVKKTDAPILYEIVKRERKKNESTT